MANTRQTNLQCRNSPAITPPRSPGTLGINDAASPDVGMCIPGDTAGPVGIGHDLGSMMCDADQDHTPAPAVLLLSEERVKGRMRRAAYSRAALRSAQADMTAHINGGTMETVQVEYQRDLIFDDLMGAWNKAKQSGADAVLTFCEKITADGDLDQAALQQLYGTALKDARTFTRTLGYAGKIVATVHLGATVTRKMLSLFPNPIGWGIDVVTDVAEAGVKEYAKSGSGVAASAAEIQALAKELTKKGVEEAPEIAEIMLKAQGSDLTEAEVAILETRLKSLEAKLARRISNYAAHRPVVRNIANLVNKTKAILIRRKAVLLPLKSVRWLAKKGIGNIAGALFVAYEVDQAFKDWNEEMRLFSED